LVTSNVLGDKGHQVVEQLMVMPKDVFLNTMMKAIMRVQGVRFLGNEPRRDIKNFDDIGTR
jgi:hypothetical protein